MLSLVVFLPLVAFLMAGIGNRVIGNLAAKSVTTGAVFVSAILSWMLFLQLMSGAIQPGDQQIAEWFRSGDMVVAWALKFDMLTAVMLVVVTSVSALVHLYSWGYMDEDPDQPRFFAYLSLFTFAMLMLVTADNLVQMFFGWEGVGLASYLLIGFWYRKPAAYRAAIKAFLVNRVGDFGYALGIFGLFLVFGTIGIDEILARVSDFEGATFRFLSWDVDIITTLALLLFVGAMGKSAQLPLHTWLPDAMEGPTPVSALIHAATMVTAGVFLVCRMSPLFEASATALMVVTIVGAATAFFAATVAPTQFDIKRVIAYSTCSQLGYMFFAAGVGAYGAAMFHLFTHAFFKALLFLGAGSVIHAMHHEQDMRFYGGLRRHIPITFWTMLIGTIAITGVWYTAGYFSKDAILFSAWNADTPVARAAFWVGIGVALLTSFYSWRLMFLTFFGAPRWSGSEHIAHAVHHDAAEGHPAPATDDTTAGYRPHESPWVMLLPLLLLALGALFAGILFEHQFVGGEEAFWAGALVHDAAFFAQLHDVPGWVHWAPAIVMLAGLGLAFRMYVRRTDLPEKVVAAAPRLHRFFFRKWYFDELYDALFVRPAFWLGGLFSRTDKEAIDRVGADGMSEVVAGGATLAKRFQTGYLTSYALVMLIGVAALLAWFTVRG
ncbi:MAG: NADH-quinone oxidoreductase subunit L [Thermaurantiacus sp.]